MKKIDIKSALIGVFFTTTVIFSLGAAGKKDAQDGEQMWEMWAHKIVIDDPRAKVPKMKLEGEPFQVVDGVIFIRKRIK